VGGERDKQVFAKDFTDAHYINMRVSPPRILAICYPLYIGKAVYQGAAYAKSTSFLPLL
jgi:hypothetical protein